MHPVTTARRQSETRRRDDEHDETDAMDGDKFRNTMHSLNYGTVMEAAARNYMKEKTAEEDKMRAASRVRAMDARDFIEVRRESVECARRVRRI